MNVSRCIAGHKIFAYPKVHNPFLPSMPKKEMITSTMNGDADNDSAYNSDSLATPRLFENNYAADVNEGNRSLKLLAILSLGLTKDDGSPLFNPSILPWTAALRPSVRNEVKRSCNAGNVPHAPRPNQWTGVAKCTEWLEKNPTVAVNEVAYMKTTIAHRITVARAGES